MDRFSGFGYIVEETKDGKVRFLFDEGHPEEKELVVDDHSVFDSLQAIIMKHKMYNYDGNYQPEFDVYAGLDFYLMYDAQVILFGIDWDIYGLGDDSKLGYMDIAISAYYPFGTKAITPFLGGGLAYSHTEYQSDIPLEYRSTNYNYSFYDNDEEFEDGSSGLTGFIGGGVMFNRSSRVMFIAQAKYMINFYKNDVFDYEKMDDGRVQITSKDHAVQGFVFNVGIGYGF